ncbi:MAG TPA: class I SAM-dependent methyltransferase [Elainellaceae cyanobacterium]
MTNWKQWITPARLLALGVLAVGLGVAINLITPQLAISTPPVQSDTLYRYQEPSRDGIGKVYMEREISNVMGHRGAFWLERPSREREEQPQKIVDALPLNSDDIVVDLGAGTGYMTFLLAPRVPNGQVFAVDIQPEMLDIVEFLVQENEVSNVETIQAELDDPHLPNGVDWVLMVDAYHEFEYPHEVMTAVVNALNSGGNVVLAEYRGENPFIPIKRLHKMTQQQVRREMNAVGLEWIRTEDILPRQHLMVFEKP